MPTVTVEVAGREDHEVDLAEVGGGARPETPTYADLLSAVGLSPHEASVLVEGRPVPEDRPVEAERVTVLRLIKGG